jgi:hypothetical protein
MTIDHAASEEADSMDCMYLCFCFTLITLLNYIVLVDDNAASGSGVPQDETTPVIISDTGSTDGNTDDQVEESEDVTQQAESPIEG